MNEIIYVILILAMFVLVFFSFFAGKSLGKRYMFEIMQQVVEDEKKKALKKSRSVIGGQVSEQLAPLLPNFPVLASECRFIGKPIDFVAFKGLDNKEIEEIVLIEVKSGKSSMSPIQRSVRKAIAEGRVRFEEVKL